MKKILFIFICTLSYTAAISQSESECEIKDCLSSPISSGCITWCQSFNTTLITILNNASESELKLIGGFEGELVIKIMDERNATETLNAVEFEAELTSEEIKSFHESIAVLNQERINYFNLPDTERKQIKKKLDKIMIEVEQH